MTSTNSQRYFRSPFTESRDPAVGEAPGMNMRGWSRRQFLEAAGFTLSMAAVSGCGRAPVETALPFPDQPEGVVPGRLRRYASTCGGCSAGCGLLVSVRDGRPLKMEGMPEHPVSHGGLCAIGQALPLGLYDSHRLTGPLAKGQTADWEMVDTQIRAKLLQVAGQGAVVVITPTLTSPTLLAMIQKFLSSYEDGRHVVFDAISSSAILEAHEQTFGQRVLPRYRFDHATVIVSFGADFLGTWISPVEYTAGWRSRRRPTLDDPTMSYHVQLEPRLSLTGSNADRRYRVTPDEYITILGQLATHLAPRASCDAPPGNVAMNGPLPAAELADLADRLWSVRGESLLVSDSQDVAVQRLINYLNNLLGNYGNTLDLTGPSRQRQSNDREVLRLTEDLKSGRVAALFVVGTDLTYHLPDRNGWSAALKHVRLVVSVAERMNDFGSLAHYVCPDHHPLEAWLDAEPVEGIVSLCQPTLAPLGGTRSVLESLDRWMGGRASAWEIIRSYWREEILPRTGSRVPFQAFWDQALHDGVVALGGQQPSTMDFQSDRVVIPDPPGPAQGLALSLYAKVGLTDSRHAHNPWLQELPDPVTKVTWDNYVCVSPSLAREHQLRDGDMVRVTASSGESVELPVFVQPGQHDRTLAVALGYGVPGTDRFQDVGPVWLESRPTVEPGDLVGRNVSQFITLDQGQLQFYRNDVTLTRIPGRRELATTQQHHTLEVPRHVAPPGAEVRDAVQETTLIAFARDPRAGTPHVHPQSEQDLWPDDHPKTGPHWGLVVDLNCCTGCSACLIACQSENNVPVVGKDEVRREREMHWIRVDRYYSGPDDDLRVAHQPMMCHHCDHAPCETVCPVLATVHGSDGLNQQVYNRCVGTRYCANNCPYKVRRFNWFRYRHDDKLQNLALNPDVTVRGRGVMEKCSMCVQRIEEGRLEARRLGQPVADGSIQTACQQSCPAQAITFGDLNDPHSRVHSAEADPRRYAVLGEFNFRPSVAYLRMVRNRLDARGIEPGEGSQHA